jgi:hypothetical protein
MFIGHLAVGLAAKRVLPTVSLGTLFLSVQFADLLWPTFVLLGFESFTIQPGITVVTPLDFVNYPYSHSLIMSFVWALVFSMTYWAINRSKIYTVVILGVLVLSHWILDFVSHRADMPLTVWGEKMVGLGLWNSLPGTMFVEITMFIIGVVLYLKSTQSLDSVGRYSFWILVMFLLVIYLGNIFGPLPPSTNAVAWSAQAIWLLVAWGYWIDRHRIPKLKGFGDS